MNTSKGSGPIADINVTPLVDVMLVLLIIFMVTATLIKDEDRSEREVDMTLPETRTETTPETSDQERLILRIDSQLQVSLNDEPVADCAAALTSTARDRFEACFNEVQSQISENAAVAEQNALYILAELDVPYGLVVGILHRIRVAGVDRVGMVTNPVFLSLGSPAESN